MTGIAVCSFRDAVSGLTPPQTASFPDTPPVENFRTINNPLDNHKLAPTQMGTQLYNIRITSAPELLLHSVLA